MAPAVELTPCLPTELSTHPPHPACDACRKGGRRNDDRPRNATAPAPGPKPARANHTRNGTDDFPHPRWNGTLPLNGTFNHTGLFNGTLPRRNHTHNGTDDHRPFNGTVPLFNRTDNPGRGRGRGRGKSSRKSGRKSGRD